MPPHCYIIIYDWLNECVDTKEPRDDDTISHTTNITSTKKHNMAFDLTIQLQALQVEDLEGSSITMDMTYKWNCTNMPYILSKIIRKQGAPGQLYLPWSKQRLQAKK